MDQLHLDHSRFHSFKLVDKDSDHLHGQCRQKPQTSADQSHK